MDTRKRELYFVATVLAATVAGGGYFAYKHRAPSAQLVQAHIFSWYHKPRVMAQLMTERYGPPNTLGRDVATWHERGPWKRIVVHGDSPDTCLEQVIAYWAPPEAANALRDFGHGLRFDAAREELSVKSGDESLNFLTLNLADRLASGKSMPEEAQRLFARTAALAAAGKSSPYTEKLLFSPHRSEPLESWSRPIEY